jgi:hypothetical protein
LERLAAAFREPAICKILVLRHKFIAHAADKSNRPDVLGPTLDQIATAHRILVRIAYTISGTILYDRGAGGVPIPQFDQFRFLDERFVAHEHLGHLANSWRQWSDERESWLQNAVERVFAGPTCRLARAEPDYSTGPCAEAWGGEPWMSKYRGPGGLGAISAEQLSFSETQAADFVRTRKCDNPHLAMSMGNTADTGDDARSPLRTVLDWFT